MSDSGMCDVVRWEELPEVGVAAVLMARAAMREAATNFSRGLRERFANCSAAELQAALQETAHDLELVDESAWSDADTDAERGRLELQERFLQMLLHRTIP